MSELIYNDFEYKVFYSLGENKFYIENEDKIISEIHIEDNLNLCPINENIKFFIRDAINNLYKKCKYCNKYNLNINEYCNDNCKFEHKYLLRRNQEEEIGDEIRAIKERVFNCEYCNISLENKHADHIFPLKNYGDNYYDNIAIVCQACNSSKSNKDLLEWAEEKGLKLPKNIINHYYWLLKRKK